jgi:hypothetical protein
MIACADPKQNESGGSKYKNITLLSIVISFIIHAQKTTARQAN